MVNILDNLNFKLKSELNSDFKISPQMFHRYTEGEYHKDLSYVSKDLNIQFKSINMVSSLKKFTI